MNRRDFLVCSSTLAATGLLSRGFAADAKKKAAPAPALPEFKPLRRDVGIFTARGGTIGWLVNKDAIAAIDTQFPDTAPLFLNGLPGRNGRKLDVVVNTHHHGDHTGGNGVFKPQAKTLVAHANVPELQRQRAAADKKGAQPVFPDTTFPDTWKQALGGETVSAKYQGPAHTKGDIVTIFEQANVIHMGDLMFNRIYPVIDRPGGASIKGWIGLLEKVHREYPADAQYIFGHGSPKFGVSGTRADLLVFRDFLSGLLDYTQQQIAAGTSREKLVAVERIPGFSDFEPQGRVAGALGAAYDELTATRR